MNSIPKLMLTGFNISSDPVVMWDNTILNDRANLEVTFSGDYETASNLARRIQGNLGDIEDYLPVGDVIIKCKHCGQWGARQCECKKCGAPID